MVLTYLFFWLAAAAAIVGGHQVLLVEVVNERKDADGLDEDHGDDDGAEDSERLDWQDLAADTRWERTGWGERSYKHCLWGFAEGVSKSLSRFVLDCFDLEWANPEIMEDENIICTDPNDDNQNWNMDSGEVVDS